MPKTRRSFLLAAAGVISAASLGVTVVGGSVYKAWWDQPHSRNLRFLSDDEIAFTDALADAIFPPSPNLPLRGREAEVGVILDDVLAGMVPFQRKMLRLSFHLLDQYPLATHGKPFRELDEIEGAKIVAAWAQSDIAELRGLVAGTYVFVAMAYSVNPKVAPTYAANFPCGYGR